MAHHFISRDDGLTSFDTGKDVVPPMLKVIIAQTSHGLLHPVSLHWLVSARWQDYS